MPTHRLLQREKKHKSTEVRDGGGGEETKPETVT